MTTTFFTIDYKIQTTVQLQGITTQEFVRLFVAEENFQGRIKSKV